MILWVACVGSRAMRTSRSNVASCHFLGFKQHIHSMSGRFQWGLCSQHSERLCGKHMNYRTCDRSEVSLTDERRGTGAGIETGRA